MKMKGLLLGLGLFMTPTLTLANEVPTVPDKSLSNYCKMMVGVASAIQEDRNNTPSLTENDFFNYVMSVDSVVPKTYLIIMTKHVFHTYNAETPAEGVQHADRWECHLHVDLNVPYGTGEAF